MPEETVVQLSVPNVPAKLKAKLEDLAEREDRSLASYIRIILEKHVQAVDSPESARKPAPVAA